MALRRFCVGLAPNFLQQTRASVGVALHGLSRRSFSTSDGEFRQQPPSVLARRRASPGAPHLDLSFPPPPHTAPRFFSNATFVFMDIFLNPQNPFFSRSLFPRVEKVPRNKTNPASRKRTGRQMGVHAFTFRLASVLPHLLLFHPLPFALFSPRRLLWKRCAESGEGDAEGGSERVSPQVRESSSSSASFYGGGGGYQERGRSRSVGTTDAGTDNFDLKLKSVSENRLFYPGQTYETDDLAPRLPQFSVDMFTTPQKTMRAPMRGRAVDKQLLQTLDFRNARLLTQFVSDTGKILPKRKTGLSSKVQRKMSRVIKLSRVMGILPFTEKLKIPSGRRN